jgi:hypothetical protein
MATLYISEYRTLTQDAEGNLVIAGKEPAIATQAVTFTTSAVSSPFNAETRYIRHYSSAAAHLNFGADPGASVLDYPVSATTPEYVGVSPGHKVAVTAA